MQRVVIVFVGILTVVRATPFDLDSVNRPTPFRYTSAFSEGSEHKDDKKIETFESGKYSNFIDESDEGLKDLFDDLELCEHYETPPKEGCVYVADGSVYFIRAFTNVNIKDAYKVFKKAGIEECEVREDEYIDMPGYSCFWIDEGNKTVYLIDVYYDGGIDEIDDIRDIMRGIDKCDMTGEIPEEGCALFVEDSIHLIHVLTEDNIEYVRRALSKLDLTECIFDESGDDHILITTDPCYKIFEEVDTISFLNLPGGPEGDQDDDDNDNGEETYEILDKEVLLSYSIQTATGNGYLQKLKLKGLFNLRSSVAKKAKAFLPKEKQSRKHPQEQRLGRRGHQHGRHGNNGGSLNHRPKWMKYLQTNA